MRRNDAKFKADKRQTSTQPPPVSTEAKTADTSEQAAKSKPDKRQTSTQPTTVSAEAKSANTSEQAAKSKPDKRQTRTQPTTASETKSANTLEQAAKSKLDKRQTSTQPPPASREAKSANTSEEAATEAFFDTMQSLRQQEISDKAIAQVLIRNLLIRINAFFGQIDQAFKEQPINLAWLPDVKPNQQRLTAYVKYYALVAKLLRLAVELSIAISSMPNTKPTGTGAEDAR
jgi:hypothetical protein